MEPSDMSLWDILRQQLQPGEFDEAKRVIGHRVRRNKEAWAEFEALVQMLAQFSDQNSALAEEADAAAATRARLLHAPHRALVLQELQLLTRQFEPALVGLLDDKDKRAYDFIRGTEHLRPSTATSTAPSTAASVPSSCASDLSVNSLRDLEHSVTAVRQAFDEEYEEILARIAAVNEELEGEARTQGEALHRKKVLEPSTADLQRLAKKLQHVAALPRPDEKLPSARRVHRLRSLVQSFRPSTPLAALGVEDAPSPKAGATLEELFFAPPALRVVQEHDEPGREDLYSPVFSTS